MDIIPKSFLTTLQQSIHKLESHYTNIFPHGPAIAYALSGPGKRLRPYLTQLCYQAAGGEGSQAHLPGLAIEMVHTYSLVHDDLPCMDDDDLRRGRPTVHTAFDEATALLVGDALLTDAFKLLCAPEEFGLTGFTPPPATSLVKAISILSQAAGAQGMIAGQAQDIYWQAKKVPERDVLDQLHRQKTGQLFAASCGLGALWADPQRDLAPWLGFGEAIGLAFQIQDDLLDQSPLSGKTPGKDLGQEKLTYLRFVDKDAAAQEAQGIIEQALADLQKEARVELGEVEACVRGLMGRLW